MSRSVGKGPLFVRGQDPISKPFSPLHTWCQQVCLLGDILNWWGH